MISVFKGWNKTWKNTSQFVGHCQDIISDYLFTNEAAHHINACNQLAVAMWFEATVAATDVL